MLRQTLLYLSAQKQLRRWVEHSSFSSKLTARFIAGFSLDEELSVVRKLESEGILATLDFLGENVHSVEEAYRCRDSYLTALRELQRLGVAATISIKLTQIGLDVAAGSCVENVAKLVEAAAQMDSRVEIDMESSEYTERTLGVVVQLQDRYPGRVRAVIQAYLRRSEADIRMLSRHQIPVRLCKGAYRELPTVAFATKPEVDRNYWELTKLLLSEGTYPAVASHDETIIRQVTAHVREKHIRADSFEFQMLYGIRRDLQKELVNDGFRLRLYVPYGDAWYPYFMRRLAERPENLLFLLRNLIRN